MSRATRGILTLLLLAALVAATGLVMSRNRKMSLFLDARDRIGRGEERTGVLHRLARSIDWPPEPPPEARAVAEEVLGPGVPAGSVELFRAGDWALLRGPGESDRLLDRTQSGWKEHR